MEGKKKRIYREELDQFKPSHSTGFWREKKNVYIEKLDQFKPHVAADCRHILEVCARFFCWLAMAYVRLCALNSGGFLPWRPLIAINLILREGLAKLICEIAVGFLKRCPLITIN